MENEQQIGPFAAFVLLSSATWDVEKCRTNLAEDWGIAFSDDACDRSRGNLVFDVDGMTVVIGLMTTPVPGGEAEHNAATNYLWPDAVETTKKHRAHLLVAVLGGGHKALEIGTFGLKLLRPVVSRTTPWGSMLVEPSLNQSIILPPHKPSGKGNFRFTTGFILDFTRPTRVPVPTPMD